MEKTRFELVVLAMLALIAGTLGGVGASHFFWGQAALAESAPQHHKILVAEEFRLVDDKGRIRASLGMSGGGAGMLLYDRTGQFRAMLMLAPEEGEPVLSLADKDGVHRATVGIRTKETPYLALRDNNGKIRLSATLGQDGEPAFSLHDSDENDRAIFGTVDLTKITRAGSIEKKASFSMVFFDENTNIIWKAPH